MEQQTAEQHEIEYLVTEHNYLQHQVEEMKEQMCHTDLYFWIIFLMLLINAVRIYGLL